MKSNVFVDLSGKTFGRLTVLSLHTKGSGKGKSRIRPSWSCVCHCGTAVIVTGEVLKAGRSQSCGCLMLERIKNSNTKHGHSAGSKPSKTYNAWAAMLRRCRDVNCKNYKDYGGRGIHACERWLKFENFLADMGERPSQLTLERIDNNGNYGPDNCRWATRKEQANNRRRRRDSFTLTYQGETKLIPEWSKTTGLSVMTIRARLLHGWTIEKTLTTKARRQKKS